MLCENVEEPPDWRTSHDDPSRPSHPLHPRIGPIAGRQFDGPADVKAVVYQGDAVSVTWRDASKNEIGFRVDRRIDNRKWTTIAYRPPRLEGSRYNPQQWIDFTAPTGRPLVYRVVAIDHRDDNSGAADPTAAITLE